MKFDPFTAAAMALIMPIGYLVIKRVRSFLKQHANKIMDALLWFAARAFNRNLSRKASLRQYCRNGLARSATKYMFIPGKTQVVLETDSTFVSLKLKTSGHAETFNGGPGAFATNTRVQVIGDPGSGKSSLVKKMFRRYCHLGGLGLGNSGEWRLPILIDLKNFVPPKKITALESLGKWALQEVKKQVTSVHGYDMDQLFESHVTGKGVAVLLDGLDEVSGEDYPKVAKVLRALSGLLDNMSSQNAMLITMRTQFHQQVSADLEEIFPVAYYVQPFSPADIYDFLNRWPHFEQARRSEEIVRISSDLTDRPTLREMCTNPLVLSMYVSNDQSNNEKAVVETRTAFYSQVVEELLVARRGRQLGLQARSLLLEQRETLLGRLAFENMQDTAQAANSLSWRSAVAAIVNLMPGITEQEAENRLRELAKETGIISEERRGETFRFIHLTFCEFFAAKESAEGREDGWRELIASHTELSRSEHRQTRTRLVEVVPFAVAMLSRARRNQALMDVASLGDPQVLGRCFLETQAYAHESWDGYFAAESASLTHTSPANWTEEWLLRLHLFNVILKDRESWAVVYGYPRTAALETLFESLVGSDRDRLTRIFSSYASVDAAAAFRLARELGVDLITEQPRLIMQNLSDPAFMGLLIGQFNSSPKLVEKLALICAEAGLSQAGIALELALNDAPRALEAAIAGVPKKGRWFVGSRNFLFTQAKYGLRPSLYTYCLTLVYSMGEARDNERYYNRVGQIRRVPAPGGLFPTALCYLLAVIVVAAFVAFSYTLDNFRNDLGWVGYPLSGVLVFVTPITVICLRWPTTRCEVYNSILNVEAPASRQRTKLWRISRGHFLAPVLLPRAVAAQKALGGERGHS
ncbi:NACHT domain-containing protein [Streptomyces sp. NBC_00827]|uniref:NACHT domain-containing protein n=1 Tax=Streptomyces sp. NBC_00827 TaxID=2903677 RepID=UPI00386BC12E|nr:NACHT domain-containing protein [Streptomyces sp. NBC_00827]